MENGPRFLFNLVAFLCACHASWAQTDRVDFYGDRLPPDASARLGCLRFWLPRPACSIAYSRDGKIIAGAGNNNTVHIWDAHSGSLIRTFPETRAITCVYVTKDGRNLVGGTIDGVVYFWDIQTGVETKRISVIENETRIACIALSPDGKLMVVNDGSILHFWSLDGDRDLGQIRNLDFSVGSTIGFSPDSQILAAGEYEGVIHLWNRDTGKEIRTIKHERGVSGIAFSPDGKSLGAVGRDSIGVWEVSTGRSVAAIPFKDHAFCLCFSPDSRTLAVGGDDGSILLWNMDSGRPIREMKLGHPVWTLAFSPDGKALAAGADRVIRVWGVADGMPLGLYPGHLSTISDVIVHGKTNTIGTASLDGTVRFWQADTGRPLRAIKIPQDEFFTVVFRGTDKAVVTGDRHGILRFWNVESGMQLQKLTGKSEIIDKIVLSADDKRVVSIALGENDTACFWDMASTSGAGRSFVQENGVCSVGFSSDGNRFVVGRSDGSVSLREVDTGRELRRLSLSGEAILSIALSNDGTVLAAGGLDGRVRVWNLVGEKKPSESPPWDDPDEHIVRTVTIAPDGRTVAYGGDDQIVRIIEASTGKVIRELDGHAGYISVLRHLEEGKKLASASEDGTVLIWDLSKP